MMAELFVPSATFSHELGGKYGSYVFPAFSTLEELRKYYPEPIEYFIFTGKEKEKSMEIKK